MTQSEQLFEKSEHFLPGGVNSPVRAFRNVGGTPVFVKSGKGSHILDEDGNDYIDYVCSYGPGILGHAYPAVIEAVKQACEQGLTFGAPTKKEYEIASLIHDMMPSMEMMRMVNSGTEAVMSAIRVARGYTGKGYCGAGGSQYGCGLSGRRFSALFTGDYKKVSISFDFR